MFQITIFFLYLIAAAAFGISRLRETDSSAVLASTIAFVCGIAGVCWHSYILAGLILTPTGLHLSMSNAASLIGVQLAIIALLGGLQMALRGLSGGLLLIAAVAAALTVSAQGAAVSGVQTWQLQSHILVSMIAYGLLCVGAIVAIYALAQDSRLRAGKLSSVNRLFAPLETTEALLYGIAMAGFISLLLGVLLGLTFVEDIFAQHLVHKSALSILALILFGVLLLGRHFAGWRGRRAVYLYLIGFIILGLAYFGSRYILEYILSRSWG